MPKCPETLGCDLENRINEETSRCLRCVAPEHGVFASIVHVAVPLHVTMRPRHRKSLCGDEGDAPALIDTPNKATGRLQGSQLAICLPGPARSIRTVG